MTLEYAWQRMITEADRGSIGDHDSEVREEREGFLAAGCKCALIENEGEVSSVWLSVLCWLHSQGFRISSCLLLALSSFLFRGSSLLLHYVRRGCTELRR